MNTGKSTFVRQLIVKTLCPVTIAALTLPLFATSGEARPAIEPRTAPISGFLRPAPWIGRRPLLLLPLQYGSDFNLDQKQFDAITPYAEQAIKSALDGTEKFSVFQANPHNPTLMRAVQDEKATQDQVNTLVKSPTLENANTVLPTVQFDYQPMIASFALGKVTTYSVPPNKKGEEQPPIVQIEITGNLYEVGNTTPVQSVTVTSAMKPQHEIGFWPNDRLLLAVDNAASQVAQQFVAPIPPVGLPDPLGPAFPPKVKNGRPITWIEPVKPQK